MIQYVKNICSGAWFLEKTARLFEIICRALPQPCRLTYMSSAKNPFTASVFSPADSIVDSDIIVMDAQILYHDLLVNVLPRTGPDTIVAIPNIFEQMVKLPKIMHTARTNYYMSSFLSVDNGLLLMMKTRIPREFLETLGRAYREAILRGAHPVSYNTGRFLYMIARFMGTRRKTSILEIGAGTGFSTLWLGLAAQHAGAKLVSYERDPDLAGLARAHIVSSNLQKNIELLCGDAARGIKEKDYYLVFIDGEKKEYIKYIQILEPLMNNTVIISHNTLSHPIELREFIEKIYGKNYLSLTLMPDNAGLTVSLYHINK